MDWLQLICRNQRSRSFVLDAPNRPLYAIHSLSPNFCTGGLVPETTESEKPKVTLPGTVEKIIPANSIAPGKAQIAVEGADHLYREIRVDNTLEDKDGKKVGLKPGAQVDVKIEADKEATVPKK